MSVGQANSLVNLEASTTIQIRDPLGNILQPGDPGVQILEQDGCTSIYVDIPTVFTPDPNQPSATWEILLGGTGGVSLRAVAQTGLHVEYRGDQVLSAGKPAPVRVRLSADSPAAAPDLATVTFQLVNATTGQAQDIALFDDGGHGDGAAGDGIFGGRVTPQRGLWHLAVSGALQDGSAFRRLHDIPLRVKGFGGQKPPDAPQLAGNMRMLQFAVTNGGGATAVQQAATQTFELGLDSSLGWATAVDLPPSVTLAPGETRLINVQVAVPADAAPGATEETTLLVLEAGDLAASENLTVLTTAVDELTVYLPLALQP